MKAKLLPFVLILAVALAACSSAATKPAETKPEATQPAAPAAPVEQPATSAEEPTMDMSAHMPEMFITAEDYKYIAPDSIDSGWVRVTMENKGTEDHHVQFAKLNDGVTAEQFEAALEENEGPALGMVTLYGGVGAIAPGMTASAVLDLPAGNYVILCLIPSPSDHVAHHSKGMVKALTVTDADGGGVEPVTEMSVEMHDFAYNNLPDTLPSGPVYVKLTNSGPESHEFNILKLADGKTVDDVEAFLSGTSAGGPPPFTAVGGANGLTPGIVQYAELNLDPGNYVAICNIPSPAAHGEPHFMLGMIEEFSVN